MSELAETEDTPAQTHPKRKPKKRLRLILLIVFLIIVGGTIYVMHHLDGSSVGVVTNPSTTQQTAGLAYNFNPVPVSGTYINFAYPQAFSIDPNTQKPVTPILESYVYRYSDIETWVLAITVTKLSSNSLAADSGYYARSLDPSRYHLASLKTDQKTYSVMTDTAAVGFNEVAYSLHNGMSADISLIGNDSRGTADLQEAFSDILASFSWR